MLLHSDPWIAAQIDEVVAPYVGRLPARELEWMRQQLAYTLESDEAAASLFNGARPRHVDESGEIGSAPPAPTRLSVVKRPKAG